MSPTRTKTRTQTEKRRTTDGTDLSCTLPAQRKPHRWLLVLVTAAFVVWLIAKVLTAIGKPIMITVVVVVAIAVISILVMAVGESVTADKPVAATSKARRSSATASPLGYVPQPWPSRRGPRRP